MNTEFYQNRLASMDSPINSQFPPSNDEFTKRAQSRRVELVLLSTLFLQILLSGLMVTSLMMNSSKDNRNRAAEFSPNQVEEKQYIVKYKDPATARGAALEGGIMESAAANQAKGAIQNELRAKDIEVQPVSDMPEYATLVTSGPSEEKVVESLREDPGVEYVEENVMMELRSAPNDTYYNTPRPGTNGFLWNLDLIKVPQAWDLTNGGSSSIKVAVIDSGVIGANVPSANNFLPTVTGPIAQLSELAGTRFTDPTVIFEREKVNGVCTSLNQTKVLSGWYVNNEHGSHVTSTIAQMTNNNAHASGVAPNVTIMPIAVGTNCGSTVKDMVQAIDLAVQKGARVINISMGMKACTGWPDCSPYGLEPDQYYSQYTHEAVQRAYDKGVLVVVASGNDANRTDSFFLTSPSNEPLVLTVGAVRADKKRAYYSSYKPFVSANLNPPINRGIDIMAPGGQLFTDEAVAGVAGAFPWQDSNGDGLEDAIIQSTLNTKNGQPTMIDINKKVTVYGKDWYCKTESYGDIDTVTRYVCGGMQGTSMASPHVAAVAALMLSVNPNLTPLEIKNILKQTAQKDFSAYNQLEYGAGIIDAFQAVTVAKSGATPPTPTPSPVVTPTPTPSPVVTPTPTPSPVVTPTPTPSPVVTPTPTPSPVVTPTPTPTTNRTRIESIGTTSITVRTHFTAKPGLNPADNTTWPKVALFVNNGTQYDGPQDYGNCITQLVGCGIPNKYQDKLITTLDINAPTLVTETIIPVSKLVIFPYAGDDMRIMTKLSFAYFNDYWNPNTTPVTDRDVAITRVEIYGPNNNQLYSFVAEAPLSVYEGTTKFYFDKGLINIDGTVAEGQDGMKGAFDKINIESIAENQSETNKAWTMTNEGSFNIVSEGIGQAILTKLVPTPPPSTLIGDINDDGVVNSLDYTILIENYLKSPLLNPRADLNGDGKVNSIDYTRFVENYLKRRT